MNFFGKNVKNYSGLSGFFSFRFFVIKKFPISRKKIPGEKYPDYLWYILPVPDSIPTEYAARAPSEIVQIRSFTQDPPRSDGSSDPVEKKNAKRSSTVTDLAG